jgi:hypothetical protein
MRSSAWASLFNIEGRRTRDFRAAEAVSAADEAIFGTQFSTIRPGTQKGKQISKKVCKIGKGKKQTTGAAKQRYDVNRRSSTRVSKWVNSGGLITPRQ